MSKRNFEKVMREVHEIAEGRLKDWKEEEHTADKLLRRLVKKEKVKPLNKKEGLNV